MPERGRMSDDLVHRLRQATHGAIHHEAADCIEKLQARIDAIMPLLDESVERGNRIEELEKRNTHLADIRERAMNTANNFHARIEVLEAEILKWLDLGKRSADRIEALESALRIIAGYDPPIDKMMGDIELSRRALKGKS